MTEDTQLAQEELKDTAEAMPTSDQPAEEVEQTDSEDLSLPDGVQERTREQFEKLKKQLADEKAKNASKAPQHESVMEDLFPSFTPPKANDFSHLNQAQVNQVAQEFVSESGEVDIALLNRTLREANERAARAEQAALEARDQARRFEETQVVKQAHVQYPQMDPNSPQFDRKFYELVKNDLIGQMMKGKQDLMEAAQRASELYSPQVDVTKQREQAVSEYKQAVTKKEQAGASRGAKGGTPTDLQDLQRRTLQGDKEALYARLKASGY